MARLLKGSRTISEGVTQTELDAVANASLPLAGGTMSGNIVMGDDTSIGIADDAERIEFDGAGDISVLGANLGIGMSTATYLLDIANESGSGIQYCINIGAGTGCSDGPAIRFAAGAGPAEIAGLRACLGGTAYGSEFVFKTSRWTGSAISYTHVMTMQHNGDLLSYTGSDSIGTLSDKRLKKNIEDFSYSLDTFKQFETKTFDWINPDAHASSGKEIGFLAQDVKLIDSRWVSDTFINQDHADYDLIQDTHFTDIDENENETLIGKTTATILGRKDVMYISVIQQLLGKVETLEAKVTALESA